MFCNEMNAVSVAKAELLQNNIVHEHIQSKAEFSVQGLQQTHRGVSKAKMKPRGTRRFLRARLVSTLQRRVNLIMTQNTFIPH